MKIKRSLFSVAVFLSVCTLIMTVVLFEPSGQPIKKDINQPSENDHLNKIPGNYIAPSSDRLYYEAFNNTQSDENTNETEDPHTTIYEDYNSQELSLSVEKNKDQVYVAEDSQLKIDEFLYLNIGISIADTYVNIREEASTDSKIIGRLYKDAAAKILDTKDDWCYIESGNIKGYIKSEFIRTGIPFDELKENYGTLCISVNADGLNVRKSPEIDSERVAVIYQNECYPVSELSDEWVKINIPDKNISGYVKNDYVELLIDFKKAEPVNEAVKKSQQEVTEKDTEIKYRSKFEYTEDDLKLLACLIHAEAGNQSYEGKLAVANVVLNRVKSEKFPDTIKEVIYQPGQFTVAKNGSLAKQLKNYNNYSTQSHLASIKAAKAALSGKNNIGSRMFFNEYKASVRKGYHKKKNCIRIDDHLFW